MTQPGEIVSVKSFTHASRSDFTRFLVVLTKWECYGNVRKPGLCVCVWIDITKLFLYLIIIFMSYQ